MALTSMWGLRPARKRQAIFRVDLQFQNMNQHIWSDPDQSAQAICNGEMLGFLGAPDVYEDTT